MLALKRIQSGHGVETSVYVTTCGTVYLEEFLPQSSFPFRQDTNGCCLDHVIKEWGGVYGPVLDKIIDSMTVYNSHDNPSKVFSMYFLSRAKRHVAYVPSLEVLGVWGGCRSS
jgi:hypothetical protein